MSLAVFGPRVVCVSKKWLDAGEGHVAFTEGCHAQEAFLRHQVAAYFDTEGQFSMQGKSLSFCK